MSYCHMGKQIEIIFNILVKGLDATGLVFLLDQNPDTQIPFVKSVSFLEKGFSFNKKNLKFLDTQSALEYQKNLEKIIFEKYKQALAWIAVEYPEDGHKLSKEERNRALHLWEIANDLTED